MKKTRKEKQAAHLKALDKDRKNSKKLSLKENIAAIIFLVLMLFLSIDAAAVYEKTIIEFSTLLCYCFLGALLLVLVLKAIDKDILFFWGDVTFMLVEFALIIYAFFVLFIYANALSFHKNTTTETVEILDIKMRSPKRSKKYPTAKIAFSGQEKFLRFSRDNTQKLKTANQLLLEIRPGNLGYFIVENRTIMDN